MHANDTNTCIDFLMGSVERNHFACFVGWSVFVSFFFFIYVHFLAIAIFYRKQTEHEYRARKKKVEIIWNRNENEYGKSSEMMRGQNSIRKFKCFKTILFWPITSIANGTPLQSKWIDEVSISMQFQSIFVHVLYDVV